MEVDGLEVEVGWLGLGGVVWLRHTRRETHTRTQTGTRAHTDGEEKG